VAIKALVVGSLVEDLAFRIPKRPEAGEVIIADHFGTYRGGKGYNQAVALARLGAEVTMVGAVGTDAYGDGFLAALEREGIDAGRVVQLRGTATAVAVPLITRDGEVGYVQYPGANRHLSPAHCADLPDCDVLLLQGEVTPAASEWAARVIGRRGGIVVLNPAPVQEITSAMLDAATVVCPNEIEARALTSSKDATVEQLAESLVAEHRFVAVTLGARGAFYIAGDERGSVTPPAVQAIDTTGAGAAFTAGLALAFTEGRSFEEAVRFGCAAGALSTTVQGAEPSLPTRAAVEALIRSQAAELAKGPGEPTQAAQPAPGGGGWA
jgi:ribokinase